MGMKAHIARGVRLSIAKRTARLKTVKGPSTALRRFLGEVPQPADPDYYDDPEDELDSEPGLTNKKEG